MDETLAALGERAEAAAWTDLVAAAPAGFAAGVGLKALRIGTATAICAPRADAPEFNRAFALGIDRPLEEGELDELIGLYRPHGLKWARLQVSPVSEPRSKLEGWLTARGLTRSPLDWAKMARPAAGEVPDIGVGLRIEEAGPGTAEVFAATVRTGFGMPPALDAWLGALVGRPGWRTYLAYDGETPVCAAAMFEADDWAWIGVGATHPDQRRKGGQGALMARRIRDAAASGKKWVLTETGAPTPERPDHPSYRNMVRCGFSEICRRANWVV